jgi:23S rRNA (uracil1939-C5)-methyltransferase
LLLNIEKLIYGGDGLARLPPGLPREASPGNKDRGRGKAVFIPFVLAGENVEATLTEEKPGFARAKAEAIVEPSPHRIPPPCPHFTRCGGCHYQHSVYEHQLQIKKEILRENLRRIAKLELHPTSPRDISSSPRMNSCQSNSVPSARPSSIAA